jgi:hypothetical protein
MQSKNVAVAVGESGDDLLGEDEHVVVVLAIDDRLLGSSRVGTVKRAAGGIDRHLAATVVALPIQPTVSRDPQECEYLALRGPLTEPAGSPLARRLEGVLDLL